MEPSHEAIIWIAGICVATVLSTAVASLAIWMRGIGQRLREAERDLYHATESLKERREHNAKVWECLNEIKSRVTRIEANQSASSRGDSNR